MLQWFISFPDFAESSEFLFYSGKTPFTNMKQQARSKKLSDFFLIWNKNQFQHHKYPCMFFQSKALDMCTWNRCCRWRCRISLLRFGMDFDHTVSKFPSSLLKQGQIEDLQ